MSSEVLLRLEEVVKKFGDTPACDGVSLELKAGRIIGLLGENGAGKSTLVSLLAGQLQPDGGRFYIDGKVFSSLTTEQAIRLGIGCVHQTFKLVPSMTVLENFLLIPIPGFFFTRKRLIKRIDTILSQYQIDIPLTALVSELTMGQRQQVEIVKLLLLQAKILLLDEPTALLSQQESRQLFTSLLDLKAQNKSILLVTHKLKEALTVCDDIGVLEHGRLVRYAKTETIADLEQLTRWVVGDITVPGDEKEHVKPGQVILKVEGLTGGGVEDVSFSLRQGEVFCLVGFPGNGQKEIVEAVCGYRKVEGGGIVLFGEQAGAFYQKDENRHLVSHIAEERGDYQGNEGLSVLEAFLLTTRKAFTDSIWLDRAKAVEVVERLLQEFDIDCTGVDQPVAELSGGNLQRLFFARAFFARPRLLVVEQPGQGLDVEAAAEIRSLLMKAREAAAILVVTSDLTEAVSLADTVGVMSRGRLSTPLRVNDQEALKDIPRLMAATR